jgi:hypothetical protein
MKKLLRYAVCVLVSFMAAAYAVSLAIDTLFFLRHRYGAVDVFFDSSKITEEFGTPVSPTWHWSINPAQFFVWHLLPVALSLWLCVIVWQLRKGPIDFPIAS